MAQYCTCPICVLSPARPAQFVQGPIEAIQGAKVIMQPGWTLAHWSPARFTDMTSIEIHNFQQLGYRLRVGVSFYLYKGPPQRSLSPALVRMGIGGSYRYTIDHLIGNRLEVFYKSSEKADPAEVTVNLGCGGTITFDANRQATDFHATNNRPIITIR